MVNRMEKLKDITHHMVMACLSGDEEYLAEHTQKLHKWMNTYKATAEEMDIIYEVSLQAAMDGRLSCLEFMCREGIPLDELCPIIAACHGQRDIVMYCQAIGLGDVREAWSRYYNWMVCPPEDNEMDSDLMLATHWVSMYRGMSQNEACASQEVMCSAK